MNKTHAMPVQEGGSGTNLVNKMASTIVRPRPDDERLVTLATGDKALTMNSRVSLTLLHRRLGHLHKHAVRRTEALVDGLSLEDVKTSACKCETCLLNKAHKTPFDGKSERQPAMRRMFRIHSDVCGPFRIPTVGGKRYFVQFICEYTGHVFVYLLASKREVFDKLKEFHARMKNVAPPIAYLHVDGGGEFFSNEMREWLRVNGISYEITCADTPQQNGLCERTNRTLLEMVRSLLHESGLSSVYWGEALLTAEHILNRIYRTGANVDVTATEAMFGYRPNLERLRVFGCAAYALIPSQQRHKLQPNARKCILLGFGDEKRGYKLLEVQTKRAFYSKDVTFDESNFPAKTAVQVQAGQRLESASAPPDQLPEVPDEQPAKPDLVTAADSEPLVEAADRGRRVLEPGVEAKQVQRPRRQMVPSLKAVEAAAHARIIQAGDEDLFEFAYRLDAVDAGCEPTYSQAMAGPDREKWLEGILEEKKSLEDNKTYVVFRGVPPKRPIRSKLVLKRKRDKEGNIIRFKVRLVGCGFGQRPGIDYGDTFAPVARMTSFRVFLAVVAHYDLELHHFDVDTAFLNGDLEEDIYMQLPAFFDVDGVPTIVKLLRALYGLKQANRRWNLKMHAVMVEFGFLQSQIEPCLYIRRFGTLVIILLAYVDDFFVGHNSKELLARLKQHLSARFKIKDLGALDWALGMRITRDRSTRTITLDQEQYLRDMLTTFNMQDCKPVATPEMPGLQLSKSMCNSSDSARAEMASVPYRSAVGKLMYPMLCTRPDLANAVRQVSKFLEAPGPEHWQAVKRIFRYVNGTLSHCLKYDGKAPGALQLHCYADADWANDAETRKSVTAVMPWLCGAPVSWISKGQPTVALSTCEAEYMALSEATREVMFLRQLLADFGCPQRSASIIWEDNTQAIALSGDPIHHARNKHIDIRHHYVREKTLSGETRILHKPTSEMLADILTKPLPRPAFLILRDAILRVRGNTS